MTDTTTFSTRSNPKRGAEKAIRAGNAPSIDYGVKEQEDGRFEIVWKTGLTPAEADERDAEIASQRLAEIEACPDRLIRGDELQERFDSWQAETVEVDADEEHEEGEQSMPDLFPPAPGSLCKSARASGGLALLTIGSMLSFVASSSMAKARIHRHYVGMAS